MKVTVSHPERGRPARDAEGAGLPPGNASELSIRDPRDGSFGSLVQHAELDCQSSRIRAASPRALQRNKARTATNVCRYCVNITALAGGTVIVYCPSSGVADWVCGDPGNTPVRVESPKLWPPKVTPSVELALGA